MSEAELAAERRLALKRAVLLGLLVAGWGWAAVGPSGLGTGRGAVERAARSLAPAKSRTAVSWLNDGQPLEDERGRLTVPAK